MDDGVDRIVQHLLAHIGLAHLKSVTQHRDVARPLPQLLNITLRLLAESFQKEATIMFRRENLRTFGFDPPVAHPDLIDAVHQLRDQIKIETGAAERGDLSLRSENDPRVLNCVLEIVFRHQSRFVWFCRL